MPKQTFTINDFSGGINGYVDPLDIADNELAQCQGFKIEPGLVSVLGDMKGSYTPASANAHTNIEPGYGLFSFSADHDSNGDINNTDYIILMDKTTFDIYSNSEDDSDDDAWVHEGIDMLTGPSDASFKGSVKPCFFIADGAIRVSPGNFEKKDTGGQLNGAIGASKVKGVFTDITVDATASNHVEDGDLLVIANQEMVMLKPVDATSIYVYRNVNGSFPGPLADDSTIYTILDTKFRGIVSRKNFSEVTTLGTFTKWYTGHAHPRPPIMYNSSITYQYVDSSHKPFIAQWFKEDVNATQNGSLAPSLNIGFLNSTSNTDGTWDGAIIKLYITALYDDAKQESQPHEYSDTSSGAILTTTIAAGKEFAVWVGAEYADNSGSSAYQFNERVTGARLYYEDTTGDPGILYQLLEIDFELGCKKADSEDFTSWVESTANKSASCPTDTGKTATSRTGSNAFIFANPPKAFTYEINTGYPPNVNTHARYKTAAIANRRLFAANIYQSGKVNGDRMIQSPVNKFDILPEYGNHVIDVTKGDGDSIVKLESYADRILQFKKRTLYIINVGSAEIGEEFIESTHKNMGVQNPSQTCVTEYGVTWVNSNGVFLYDGQEIVDLTINKLQRDNTTDRSRALNIDEDNVPLIGYNPLKKWLIVHGASNTSTNFEAEVWIHDFKNGSWTYSKEFTADADYKTNMVWTSDNELVFAGGTATGSDSSSNTPDLFKYRSPAVDSGVGKLLLLTKEFNLDAPGVKKKLRSIYITYSASANTKIEADILYKSKTGTATDDLTEADSGSTYYTEADGFLSTSGNVRTVELVPTTYSTDAYTFQLKLHNPDAAYPYGADFKLYNLSFSYRPLGVR